MELLVQGLKKELEEPVQMNYEEIVPYIEDEVDEYYNESEDV